MSCTCQSADVPCGCCAGVTASTPVAIVNRPALNSIAYRIGTYSSFKASMRASLSVSAYPALAGLRTRDSSDFSLALVDAWAVSLDILAFYQERFANEAYLGTAVEPRSVFELARLVGYQPSPGVSASAVLAFSLATAPGSPASVLLPAGTRVQSVPGPGQKPQVFETGVDLNASIAANAIPAATTQPWQLAGAGQTTWIAGAAANLHPGDCLLFLSAPGGQPSTSGPANVRFVTSAVVDARSDKTLVSWDQPLSTAFPAGTTDVCLYVFRKKAALYGVQAPNPNAIPSLPSTVPPGFNKTDWNFRYAGGGIVNLDSSYPGLSPAATSPDGNPAQLQWMVLTGPKYTSFFQIAKASESNPALYTLSAKTTQLTLSTGTVLAGDPYLSLDQLLTDFVLETRGTTAYIQSELLPLAAIPITAASVDGLYTLAPGTLSPIYGGSLLLAGGRQLRTGQPIGLTGQRLRIQVLDPTSAAFTPAGATGALAVSRGQFFLVDAFPPLEDGAGLAWSVLTLDGADGAPGTLMAPASAIQLASPVSSDPQTGESALLSSVQVLGATIALGLSAPLTRIYDASTVRVNANAVLATHGETTQEILGSGDASNPALTIPLKQSPLTYTSAPTPSGVQSSLQVWVNNLRWSEVPNFLSSGPADRVFVTRSAIGGATSIQFGDGTAGARTPTGLSNLKAAYRKGIGLAGMVNAGQLTQPLDRPQGLQSVTNPGAATGGADPASPADARQRAPLPTLTLGRVVSLEDYQNFALAFPGIAKALATWAWFGGARGIFLTVAGAGGAQLNGNDPIVQNLFAALQSLGLPFIPLQISSYVPVLFEVAAQLKIDTSVYDPRLVLSAAWQSLFSPFAFETMQPGARVSASQVLQLLQSTPGVLAVNLTAFGRSGDTAQLAYTLCAAGPRPPTGAEILLLDPASEGNLGVWS